jgi:hypothetical protein
MAERENQSVASTCPDLEHKRPPDLPPGMVKLRLVKDN